MQLLHKIKCAPFQHAFHKGQAEHSEEYSMAALFCPFYKKAMLPWVVMVLCSAESV